MAKQGTLLVVDDNRNILTSLQYLLEEYFQQVITLNSPVTIPSLLQREAIDVVLLDMNFSSGINSGNEGLYWLREIKRLRPQIQVVLFTAYADINLAVTGLKDGATDFIVKPWDNAKLVQTLQEAYAKARGNEKKGKQASQPTEKSSMYWGNSSVIRPLRLLVEKVSTTDANILIPEKTVREKICWHEKFTGCLPTATVRWWPSIWEPLPNHCLKANYSVM